MSLIQSYRPRRSPLQRNPPNDTQSKKQIYANDSELLSLLFVVTFMTSYVIRNTALDS